MKGSSIGLALVLVLAASGCRVFAGPADYADYRAIRLAPDDEARLIALQQYSERQPEGQWANEVKVERAGRENETFELGKSSRSGLELYLRVYPDGTFAPQARSRLAAIELIERRRREGGAQAEQLAAARKQREAELRRTWVTRFAGYWSSTLIGLTGWGDTIPEVARQNPRFSRAFGAAPRPRCTAEECVKYYTSQFAIPVPGGTRVERTLSLVLRLRMQEGKLQRAELLLPSQGFSRWYELEERKPVTVGDGASRAAAASWAIERLQQALAPLTGELMPVASHALAPIPAPSIGPSGELTDTSAEDPSEPPKQLSGMDAPGSAAGATQADVSELVKPKEGAAPDMVFAPLGVTREGQTFEVPANGSKPAPAAGSGEVMMMDPLAVPKNDASAPNDANEPAAQGGAAPAPAPAGAEGVQAPAIVRALQGRGLRVVLFAAAGGASAPAYDGVIIERVAPAAATKPAAPKPRPRTP